MSEIANESQTQSASEPRVFSGIEEFEELVGQQLGQSDWHTITQERVNLFADATDDHQWIHVDVDRAAAGPFGGPVAHGYLTLSLIPMLGKEIYRIDNLSMGINYGVNKVRFPQPVRVGTKVRATAELVELTEASRGKQAVVRWTLEIDGEAKPACVAETVAVLVP